MVKLVGKYNDLSRKNCEKLKALGDIPLSRGEILSETLAQEMLQLSEKIKREVAIFHDRNGYALLVSVGDVDRTAVYDLKKKRWEEGYSGVSCIHTHPNGSAFFSDADISALQSLHYDFMLALAKKNDAILISLAMLKPENGNVSAGHYLMRENMLWHEFNQIPFYTQLLAFESQLERKTIETTENKKERALLVLQPSQGDQHLLSLVEEELRELSDTAGLEVVDVVVQNMRNNQKKIGTGKLEEISMRVQVHAADVVIFDQSLSPSYNQLLSDALGIKVIDKTVLILDIFAQRARSKEGKLQVELAQLNYLLPRLKGMGHALSRLGGGIGTRGPGETKLETDRRHIRNRIHTISNALEAVKANRNLQRSSRSDYQGLHVALLGYTNAGKSSLLNYLSKDNIYVADQLFATLDTTTRQVILPSQNTILLSDTVGFIRELPPQFLDAFKATLEELQYADVLLHVVDISKEGIDERIAMVEEVLDSLSLNEKKIILVCNKVDICEEIPVFSAMTRYSDRCLVSCHTGEGMNTLIELLEKLSSESDTLLQLEVPYNEAQGGVVSKAHQYGQVLKEEYGETGVQLEVKLPLEMAQKYFSEFLPKKEEW